MEEPLPPMEPVLWPEPFDDARWQFEVKWDGLRCLCYADGSSVRIYGRRGSEWTKRFPELRQAFAGRTGVFDGELVVLKEARPSFPAVMRRLHRTEGPVHYMVFDCLSAGGEDLRARPLTERQAELSRLPADPCVHRVEGTVGEGRVLYDVVRRSGLEGIVAKRRDAPYVGGRSDLWRKVKCWRELRCTVLGVEESRGEIRSVRLGWREAGITVPVGSVGGLGRGAQGNLRAALAQGPVEALVGYLDWTEDGRLRHPRWIGVAPHTGGRS